MCASQDSKPDKNGDKKERDHIHPLLKLVQALFRIFIFLFGNKRSRITDGRDKKLVPIKLENYPKGYPRIAAYINSDDDTVLHRRFGTLCSRVLLYREVELTDLEMRLAKLDEKDNSNENNEWRIGHSIHHDSGKNNEERRDLVEKIEQKLEAYYGLLLQESQVRKLLRPSERVHRNFMDYIYTENPFGKEDQRFIYHEHDFVSLQTYEESWIDELMHRLMGHCKKGLLQYIFATAADRKKTDEEHVHYYSASRLGVLIKVVIAGSSTILMLVPIYLFLTLNMSTIKMVSVAATFALLFSVAFSLFTTARRQGVFAATAAYCAFMVIFIGILSRQSGCIDIRAKD